MAQSLVKNNLHIIFSTKNRQPLIDEHIEKNLFSYLGGICNGLESYPIKIGGHSDHIHILCHLSKRIALIKFMQELKAQSSKWIKTMDERYKNFFWQDGYGAFSVTPSGIQDVKRYIDNQHEHHRKQTFQEEYREFLRVNDVEYDERYVWD